MKLVTSAQMRELEQRAVTAGISESALMSQAGLAVAQEVWLHLGHVEQRRILVLVGPGNNGGDALVAAQQLAEWGATVRCYALRAPRRCPMALNHGGRHCRHERPRRPGVHAVGRLAGGG